MDLSERPTRPFVRHPWEEARFRFFEKVIRRAHVARGSGPVRVLDVGAGDGWFAARLAESLGPGTHVACWDPAYRDSDIAEFAATRGPHVSFSAAKPRGTYDLVLLLDVLEHVRDDADFLAHVVADNVDGGTVLVSVPAWPSLFGPHDVRLKHFRRYEPPTATRLVKDSGLEIRWQGGLFNSLLFARTIGKIAERVARPREPAGSGDALEWKHGGVARRLVTALLLLDGEVSFWSARAGTPLPGLSWWALATKRR